MRLHVVVLVLLAPLMSASANDAGLDMAGGGASLLEGSSTNVRMVSETVIIELHRGDYQVYATFEFYNDGETTTLPVGFPNECNGFGSLGRARTADQCSFKTSINGIPCAFDDVPGQLSVCIQKQDRTFTSPDDIAAIHAASKGGTTALCAFLAQSGWFPGVDFTKESIWFDSFSETRWFVKEVTFPAKETTRTQVSYKAPYWEVFGQASYTYGTGAAWAGTIGIARFIVRLSPDIWVIDPPRFAMGGKAVPIRPHRLGPNEFEFVLRNLEPSPGDCMILEVSPCGAPWTGEGMRWCDPNGGEAPIPIELLYMLSPEQLRLLRSFFAARHGKVFESPDLDAHFRDCYWYKPRSDFKDADLTVNDRWAIAIIKAYENKTK